MGGGSKPQTSKTRINVKSCSTFPTILLEDEEAALSQDDIRFMEIMEHSTVQQKDGSFEMPLPFKTSPQLPNNRTQAITRLNTLQNKFKKDPTYQQQYTSFIEELI